MYISKILLPYNDLIEEKHIPSIFRHALDLAELSSANRRKVGCVILKYNVQFTGYNGTVPKMDNTCEYPDGTTNDDVVIHAERNALDKMTVAGFSSVGADVFVTCSPCTTCALSLIGARVNSVFYIDTKKRNGLDILRNAGIHLIQVPIEFILKP